MIGPAGIGSGAAAVAVEVVTTTKIEKYSFATSKAGALVAEDENNNNNNNNNIATMTSMGSLIASSTNTTLTTVSTKIEEQQNETELLLLTLDDSSGVDNDDDDDSCSVSSSITTGSSVVSRYFEPTDFLPWEDLYSSAEYAPHLGFAIAAGGFACLHPFVFFAGVVTALGALRAAGVTYEYATCTKETQTKEEDVDGDSFTISNMTISCDWLPSVIGFNDNDIDIDIDISIDAITTKKAESAVAPAHSIVGDVYSVPALAKTASSCSTDVSTIGDLSDDDVNVNVNKTETHVVTDSSVPSIIQSPPKVQQQPQEEPLDPVRWVKDNYPALSATALDKIEFRGLNTHEFFDVFFADDAPFGFPAFHKLRRDKEVQYGAWNTVAPSDNIHSNISDIPSLIVAKERAVEYHAKTNSFLGPAYAPTKKTQRAYFVSKKILVIEIKMTLHDIPFSKQFYLIERWVIDGTRTGTGTETETETTGSSNSTNKNHNSRKQNKKHQNNNNNHSSKPSSSHCVYLTVSSKVYFTQECPFEAAIIKESAKQICEISKCWNAMAQEGLKRTEETRTKRLRQKQQREEEERLRREQSTKSSLSLSPELVSAMNASANNNNFENDESVEIEHINDRVNGDGHNNDRNSGRRSSRSRRSSSSQHQNQHPPQPNRPLRNRSLSGSFSKLLLRGNSNAIESSQKHDPLSLPKVRISSTGVPSC